MQIKKAKALARQWVTEKGSEIPGFCGAFFHGSINWCSDNDVLSKNSDLDLMIVIDRSNIPEKIGKFIYHGLLLEVSYISMDQLQPPKSLLSNPYIGGSFWEPSIIKDPSGKLTELQDIVSENFARKKYVVKRCEFVRNKIFKTGQFKKEDPFPDQVLSWLFSTGITTHMLLVAGLKNLTVRKRYVKVKKMLKEYNHLDYYKSLLEMLGCTHMTRGCVEDHLEVLANVFDSAKEVNKNSFFFASDIRNISRPIAIDGSRELIKQGYHRETVFWIVATYSRCQKIFSQDASPEMQKKYSFGYRDLLADLGINSFADLKQRSERVKKSLPQICNIAESIIASNPKIIREKKN